MREGLKKVIFITLGSDPPTWKVIISFLATRPIYEDFWKKVYFSLWKLKNTFKKLVLDIAQNAGHIVQNDGHTMQNVGHTTYNGSRNILNVCQGPKWGHEVPPGPQQAPSTPILEKKFVSRNDF